MSLKSDWYNEPCTSAVPLLALKLLSQLLGIVAEKDKVDSNSKTRSPINSYSRFCDTNTERIDIVAYF